MRAIRPSSLIVQDLVIPLVSGEIKKSRGFLLSNFLQPPRQFLEALEKSRKATISFVISVSPSICLSVNMIQLISHRTDFHEIWYLNIFRKIF